MQLIPAVDILDGKAVRLYQGDYNQETVYGNPLEIVQEFSQEGAQWIHLVDLQGAKNPNLRQWNLMKDIRNAVDCKLQLGGGIRSQADCERLLDIGIDRVLVGSSAIKNPKDVANWVKQLGSSALGLALDVKWDRSNPPVPWASGWLEEGTSDIHQILNFFEYRDDMVVLCTDIEKDGTLQGPALDLYLYLKQSYPNLELIASGGIRHLEDLRELKEAQIEYCVAGRSIYEGTLDWKTALKEYR